MGLYFECWIPELVVLFFAAILAVYLWFDHGYSYWKNKGVPYAQPTFPFGNVLKCMLGRETFAETAFNLYKLLPGENFVGYYSFRRPHLLVRNPDFMHQILVQDFTIFQDRGFFLDDEEPLNNHLFLLGGQKWRQLRVKLSPAFTSGKLKVMFKTIQDCGRQMSEVLEHLADRGEVVEVRELAARYTTDVIASVVFGIQVDSQCHPENEFRQWGRKICKPTASVFFSFILGFLNPKLMSFFRIKGGGTVVSQYFRRMVADTVNYREENNVSRKDFMDLLIQLKNKGFVDAEKDDDGELNDTVSISKLSMDDVAAQVFLFFAAGFETSSTTISFALHEIALSTRIQSKLQDEIDSVLKEDSGDISYESIAKMSYLDKVVSETLRKYPPLAFLNRECNKDYKIPGTDIILEKGMRIVISILGLHRDAKYFPDPERFDPERFSDEEKAKRHPYVYMPFGEGPRKCIGTRLGLLQTKIGVVYILSKYSLRVVDQTVSNVQFHPRSVVLLPQSGINLQLVKRK